MPTISPVKYTGVRMNLFPHASVLVVELSYKIAAYFPSSVTFC